MDGTWIDIIGPTSVWAAEECEKFVREHVNSPGPPNTARPYSCPLLPDPGL